MSTINIIRSIAELFMICGFSVAIYQLLILKEAQKEKMQDKPVQFNARDFFSIDID